MHRRRVLELGAALATLPLAGCAGAPEPQPAPGDGKSPADRDTPPARSASAAASEAPREIAGAPGASGAPDAGAPPASEPPKIAYTRVVAKVGKNHGHVLTVPFADVQAGVEKTFDMAGSTHPHKVTLSPDDMKALLGGKIVRTRTTTDKGHAHRVAARCAPAVDPPEWVPACRVEFSGKDEHELIVSARDLEAKADKTYDIQGVAGHAHEVKITAADFDKLAKKAAVSLKATPASDDGHTHVVVVYPEPPKPAKT